MFLKLVALLLCITYAACDDVVRSTECVNQTIHSQNVYMKVSGCNSDHVRCKLIQGNNHTVEFYFKPMKDFSTGAQKTDFKVQGVFQNFAVAYGKRSDACAAAVATDDESTCQSLGGLLANREYKHVSTFPVSSNYPKVELNVRFWMMDRRSKEVLMCQEIPVKIISASDAENEA